MVSNIFLMAFDMQIRSATTADLILFLNKIDISFIFTSINLLENIILTTLTIQHYHINN